MKITSAAAALFGLALSSPAPPPAGEKQPWLETDWDIVTRFPPEDLWKQPENVQGTWLYCSRFDHPLEYRPVGDYTSAADCRAKHYKASWRPGNPLLPCDRATGYILENCGKYAYCKQYDVEGDKPVPALFDNSELCNNFYESGPITEDS
ncbi:hypothetical protein HRG_000481 [Hirsutella rhossiliensis]|uniref:Uncharacterized protein n=1 Tax=Hirsutella rhossiliensis TaxID=111463 RepID=A0A9P8N6V0_9HYPO|nr:uncharacterized protein HRG_00481 [Hirsutella rhossiliensis]KAH0967839.1 hypothetical protein HRG_00481 [Hirsutella rhossiliensis]